MAEIPLKNNTSGIKDYEKYYLTVATPKPVITEYDVPPKFMFVFEKIAIQHNIKIKDISQIKSDINSHKENAFHKKHNIFLLEKLKEVLNLFYRLAILREVLTVHCNLSGIFLI